MSDNPILDELHQIRRDLLAECGNDIHKFLERMREREREHPDRYVELSAQNQADKVKETAKPRRKAAKRA